MLAREVTTLVHGADQVARAEHASALLFGEDIATLAGRGRARGVRRCAVDRAAARAISAATASASSISSRACELGAVEERGAAAGAVGRRLREQPARRRIAQARLTRERGDRRARCSSCARVRSRITWFG